jgi:hypothetical protein
MSARVLLLAALALGACSKQRPAPGSQGPRILRHVPADTPYVLASLQPVGREYLETYLADARADLPRAIAQLRATGEGPGVAFVIALLEELAADPTVAGYERLGFSSTPLAAFYGIGLLPAMRVEVRDAAAVQATFARAMKKSGFELPVEAHGGRTFWVYRPSVEVAFAWGLVEGELVATFAPASLLPRTLDLLVGAARTGPSLAETGGLERIAAERGFSRQLVGTIDLAGLAASLTDEGRPLVRDQLRAFGLTPPAPACAGELARLAALSPRWSFGAHELTRARSSGGLVMELAPALAAELAALRTPVPGVGAPLSGGVVSFGAALDVGRLVGVLRRGAATVAASPYRCAELQWLNEAARGLSGEVPPWIRELRGLAVVLDTVEPGLAIPTIRAYGLVAASDPVQLIDLAKRALSSLSGVSIPPDGRPVPVPGGLVPLMPGHVAMKGQLLGLSIGSGAELHLARLMSTPALSSQPVLAFAMDAEKMTKVMEVLQSTMGGRGEGTASFGRGLLTLTVELDGRGVVWRGAQVRAAAPSN